MTLTEEQKRIIATDVPRGQVMKIKAFAGCAKTTTLLEYTLARPNDRFLYIAFNTTVAAEAREKFPMNVTAKTVHSLAYGKFGYKYKEKLGFLKPYLLTDSLNVTSFPVAKYLIDVVVKFLSSSDRQITETHLNLAKDKTNEEYIESKTPKQIAYLIEKANELWKAMQDTKNRKIPMIHDGYLKLFQLSDPQLPFDYILLDEAHDTNDVTLDIFLRQNCSKILVGDPHQSIYEFRHAYDALGKTQADLNQHLSTSFRFGQSVANIANLLLGNLKQEDKEVLGFQPSDTVGFIDTRKPYTVVARTNGAIFDEAADLLDTGRNFGFIGTNEKEEFSPLKPYCFDRIMDVFYLYSNSKFQIKDAYIKRFRNFEHLWQVVSDEDAPDVELRSRASIVKKYRYDIPELVSRIIDNSVDPRKAHVLFTTAHKAKGLEWPQVKLTSDYADLVVDDDGKKRLVTSDDLNPQEINLLYVAATRAKSVLQLNRSILQLREYLEENN